MKRKLKLTYFIIFLIVISNYFSGFINASVGDGLIRTYHFESKNKDFEFILIPAKGRDIEMMENHFKIYSNEKSDNGDDKIYRTFKRNPLKFWNWYNYMTNDIYDYKYKGK